MKEQYSEKDTGFIEREGRLLFMAYIVELKIWRGGQAHAAGLEQLADYLERLNMDRGYLIIYDLRKTGRDDWKTDRVLVDGREIFIVWV